MRKILAVFSVAMLALGLIAVPASASPHPDRYVALGDSLAAGVGAPLEERTGYVPLFFNSSLRASDPGPSVLENLAVSGETTATYLAGGNTSRRLMSSTATTT